MKKKVFFTVLALFLIPGFAFAEAAGIEGEVSSPEEVKLSLKGCVRYGVYNSFEAKMAKLDLLIAETDLLYSQAVFDTIVFGNLSYAEDKRQQLSVFAADDNQANIYSAGISKKLPTGTELKASWGDTRSWSNSQFTSINPAHAAELTLEAKQPVGKNFFGYIDRNTVTVTKLAIMNADLETKDRIEGLITRIENSYWDLVFAKESLEFFKGILEKANKLHEANTKNYDIGIIEKADFLASEANVLLREADLLVAKNNYRRAEENLKLLLDWPEDERIYPEMGFGRRKFNYDLGECLEIAFDTRRDYRVRKRDVEIKKINLKMKDNQRWPEIDLTATMAMNGVDTKFSKAAGRTTVADNTYYFAGVEVSMPIENSMARSEFKKAGYEKEKAILSLKENERTIITEVGNSYRDFKTYNISVVNVKEAARLQAEKLKEEEKRFARGRSSTKRLIDYQNDLLNAELDEAQEMLDLEKSITGLERAMNVTLGKYEEAL